MSELSAITLTSTLSGAAGNFALRSSSADRLIIDTSGNVSVPGSYSTQGITASTYNGYTPLNKAGDSSTGIFDTSSTGVYYRVNGNDVYNSLNYNSVVNRGNPGAGNSLTLSRFDQVHVYSADAVSSIDIATTMVNNAVYALHYTTTSSNDNVDIRLRPNYSEYASEFTGFYYASPQDTAGNPGVINFTTVAFYFDHYGGGIGNTPCGTYILYNFSQRKHVVYHGGDTSSHSFGNIRWNNSTTQWTDIGTLTGFTGANIRVHIRRIG